MRKITDSDATAIGHFNMIGYALSGYINITAETPIKKSRKNDSHLGKLICSVVFSLCLLNNLPILLCVR
jgi:ascorbate-specific PTS system EIIC-type component UlaA